MTPAEKLTEAAKFSPGLADWIARQERRGLSAETIIEVLAATTALVRAERKAAGEAK